jgi:hypothetical protein
MGKMAISPDLSYMFLRHRTTEQSTLSVRIARFRRFSDNPGVEKLVIYIKADLVLFLTVPGLDEKTPLSIYNNLRVLMSASRSQSHAYHLLQSLGEQTLSDGPFRAHSDRE